jgi:hypothetical protein
VWPGNVRQLGMVVREGYLRAQGGPVLRVEHLAELVALPVHFQPRGDPRVNTYAIRLALEATHGNAGAAARLLHMARSTVYRYCGAQPSRSMATGRQSDSRGVHRESDTSRVSEFQQDSPELPLALLSHEHLPMHLKGTPPSDSPLRITRSDSAEASAS